MKVAALFSGGKDSVYSVYWALNQGWDVKCLLTMAPESRDSWMFHYPNIWLTTLQASSLGIPILVKKTSGEKEKELEDLRTALEEVKKRYGVVGVLAGALASEYQKTRIERETYLAGLKVFLPLWHKDQVHLLRHIVRAGFEVIISSVSSQGMDDDFLGRKLDERMVSDLESLYRSLGVWPAGEGGEFETLVLDGPVFKSRIVIDEQEIVKEKDRAMLVVKRVHLEPKV